MKGNENGQRQDFKWISKRRKEIRGMSQSRLAELTHIEVSRIVDAEAGRCDLTPEEVEKIRNAFKQSKEGRESRA